MGRWDGVWLAEVGRYGLNKGDRVGPDQQGVQEDGKVWVQERFDETKEQKNEYKKDLTNSQPLWDSKRLEVETEKKIEFSVFGFIEDVITKTIDYHLFDVVVEFHRIDDVHAQFQGKIPWWHGMEIDNLREDLKLRGSSLQRKIVSFREIHDLNFRGSLCKNLFVLSSSNRGRLLGFTDLMRQKNKRMKQEGLIQHYGILEDLKSNSSYLLI
ncbi:hypothetical protein Tco_0880204 [Tanacetum coccineum]